MANPRVLLFGRYGHPLDPGGVANATRNIATYASQMGVHFNVVSVRSPKLITDELLATKSYDLENVAVSLVPSAKGFSSHRNDNFETALDYITSKINRNLNHQPFNLVHCFTTYPNYTGVAQRLAQQMGTPYICSGRGTDVHGHNPEYSYDEDKEWYQSSLRGAKMITVLSMFLKDEMRQNLTNEGRVPPIRTIHNGVDTNYFKPLQQTGIPTNAIRIVYTGRIRNFKGITDIIKATQLARKDGVNVELDIYGGMEIGTDNGAFNDIKRYIMQENLLEFIRCDGVYRENSTLPHTYKKHNLFFLASRCEGLPNAVMEAMACGLPVALNDTSGAKDLLEDNEMKFKTGNIRQMANIIGTLAKDPEKLKYHSQRNRNFVLDHHWKNIASQYIEVYKEVIK